MEKRSLVVIDNLDLVSIAFNPSEADPPLAIDSDTVLPLTVAFEGF